MDQDKTKDEVIIARQEMMAELNNKIINLRVQAGHPARSI
jgi:hypothetical protein